MTLFDEISGLYKEEKKRREKRWIIIFEEERDKIINSMKDNAMQGVGAITFSFGGYIEDVQSFLCRELTKFFENEGFIVNRKGGYKLQIRWDGVETSTKIGMTNPTFGMIKEPDRHYYAEIYEGAAK